VRGFVLQVKVAATIESVVDASASAKLVRVRVVRPIDVGVDAGRLVLHARVRSGVGTSVSTVRSILEFDSGDVEQHWSVTTTHRSVHCAHTLALCTHTQPTTAPLQATLCAPSQHS
jgi:hypothetical protein